MKTNPQVERPRLLAYCARMEFSAHASNAAKMLRGMDAPTTDRNPRQHFGKEALAQMCARFVVQP